MSRMYFRLGEVNPINRLGAPPAKTNILDVQNVFRLFFSNCIASPDTSLIHPTTRTIRDHSSRPFLFSRAFRSTQPNLSLGHAAFYGRARNKSENGERENMRSDRVVNFEPLSVSHSRWCRSVTISPMTAKKKFSPKQTETKLI